MYEKELKRILDASSNNALLFVWLLEQDTHEIAAAI